MLEAGEIWIAPAYQGQFRCDPKRCSQLKESILLGMAVTITAKTASEYAASDARFLFLHA
jgi:hypothetical protein